MTCILVYSLVGVFPLRFLSCPAKTARYAACYLLLSSLLLLVPDGIPHASKELHNRQKCHPLAADSAGPLNPASFPFSSDDACSETGAAVPEGSESFSSLISDNMVEIDPPVLEFGLHPIGQHTDRTVKIINHSQKHYLRLVSVSGTSTDFHPSFFRSDRLAPGEHTLFDVYFLPREVGAVESVIHIHTENGLTYPLPVSGLGTQNPYQLRSLSARIPLNTTYSPVISLYNPHSTPLQVTEMYSTALDLHLELLSPDASPAAWEVPPYQSKQVMRIRFSADRFDLYTAFIRVKTTFDKETETRLIIPLEVEVLSPDSLFSSAHELDFGLLCTSDAPKSLPLSLYNPSDTPLRITSLTLSNVAPFLRLGVDMPSSLMDARTNLSVGFLQLSPEEVPADIRFVRGSVRVNASSGDTNKRHLIHFNIPYAARIEHGHLQIPKLVFHSGRLPMRPQTVSVWLSHTFRHPLAVYGASLSFPEGGSYLSLHEFRWPLILEQNGVAALSLKFMANSPLILAHPFLHIYTNTSHFELPIHIYSQQLLLIGGDELEFAVINPNITKTLSIKLHNLNADAITVRDMAVHIASLSLEKVVVLPLLEQQLISTADSAVPFVIQPNHEATLTFKLTRPSSGDVNSEVVLITDYQRLHIPVHYRSISGAIEAQRINFQPSFPGHVETRSIIVRNTFTQTVRLLDLRQLDPVDPRIYLLDQHDIDHIELTAFSSTHIARLAFDPLRGFPDKVYTGGFSKLLSVEWLSHLDVGTASPEVDTRLYEKMQAVWRECQNKELTKASARFELDTDVLLGIKVEVEASLQWPSITPDAPIHFPLTLIGNYSTQSVPVMNPSDDPIVVQALLLHFYPDVHAALDIVDDWLDIPPSPSPSASPSSFYLADAPSGRVLDYPEGPHPTSYLRDLDTSVSDLTWTYILTPKSLVNITVVFEPRDEDKTYSVILLRNNLTIMDAVVLHGTGAEGKFSLDGKMSDSEEALQFNMTNESLAICNTSKRLSHFVPSLTRTFVARNQGQLDIHIESLSINGYPCQGYGFSILQCRPFTLRPQSSLALDITFTPDFTLYSLDRQLILRTKHGQSLTFNLFASVPAEFLPLCFALAPRPPWEPYIPFVVAPLLIFATAFSLYLTLQHRKEEAVTPIPGVASTYSREGKDKVFRLAAQFSFANGAAEDPSVVKDKLERCDALIKRIKLMNKENDSIKRTDEAPHLEGMIPPILLPGHRDLVEIMRSSYDPDIPLTPTESFPEPYEQEGCGEREILKRSNVTSIETIQVEKQLNQPKNLTDLRHSNKSNPKSRTEHFAQNRNPGRSYQEDVVSKEVKSCQNTIVCKEIRSRSKPDLRVTIPSSNSSNNEVEIKNESPVTSPSAESKKLNFTSQSNRGGKLKKSKLSQKSKVKIRKEKLKIDRIAFSKESVLDSESQDADMLLTETSNTSAEVDTQQDEDHRDQMENNSMVLEANEAPSDVSNTKSAPGNAKELMITNLHTPPKDPLPLRKDAFHQAVPEEMKSESRSSGRENQTNHKSYSNGHQTLCTKTQNSNTKSNRRDHKDEINLLNRALPRKEDGNNSTSPAANVNPSDTIVNYEASCCTREESSPQLGMYSNISKSANTRSDHSIPSKSNKSIPEDNIKYNCATVKEQEKSGENIQVNEKRVPFSGMSEELKHRIEEVCAPLTFDDPPLTGETHEQLSSILSTDAEPFIPDDTVLKRLLENSPMFQSEKKCPRKQRQRSGVLDPQAIAQLSLLLQNQSQCMNVSQDDYIKLASSLHMEPRILHQHLQYCWLCYQCNLIGLLGHGPHATSQASLNLPELLSQLQQNANIPHSERTDNSLNHTTGRGLSQPSHHQALLKGDKQTTQPPSDPLNTLKTCDVTYQKGSAHLSRFSVRNTAPDQKHHNELANSFDWSKESTKLQRESNNSYIPCGFQRKQPFGSFSHWDDSKGRQDGKMIQSEKQEATYENQRTKSHDDSSFFERSVLYENLGQDPLSSSDPWSKDQMSNKWRSSESKTVPHLLTESELLPTELMNSRPPSPQNVGHPRALALKSRSTSNEQPLIFLGPTIWTQKESITEEDRLKWETITGKAEQEKKKKNQFRNSSYNPLDEKRWTPLQGRGRGDKSII